MKLQINDILDGKHPTFSRCLLKKRLLQNSLLKEECYICKLPPIWNGQVLKLQIDHINGIRFDHRLENLRLLCPNCHSQTSTFAGKRNNGHPKKSGRYSEISLASDLLKIKRKRDIHEKRQLILQSNIDFSKRGWIVKVSKILKITPQKVRQWMKTNLPHIEKHTRSYSSVDRAES